MYKILQIILILLFFYSCVDSPKAPDTKQPIKSGKGVYILCEGLMGYDNSTLAFYNFETNEYESNFYERINPNLRIGDTANDIVLQNDTLIIAITGSSSISIINANNCEYFNSIKLESNYHPRRILFVNDSIAYVSSLYSNSIIKINKNSTSEILNEIEVGPNPEYLINVNEHIIVANSGLGSINASHPLAGTLSIIDINSEQVIKTIKAGPNVIELLYNENQNKFYAAYLNTYHKDSLGGIVEFDGRNFEKLREWRCFPRSLTFDSSKQTLLFINQTPPNIKNNSWKGISSINLNNQNAELENIINNSSELEFWNAIAISPFDNSLWIANAKNFQTEGEILILNPNTYTLEKKLTNIGLNPNKFIFIEE